MLKTKDDVKNCLQLLEERGYVQWRPDRSGSRFHPDFYKELKEEYLDELTMNGPYDDVSDAMRAAILIVVYRREGITVETSDMARILYEMYEHKVETFKSKISRN